MNHKSLKINIHQRFILALEQFAKRCGRWSEKILVITRRLERMDEHP
jgi:hypothetical protein